MDETTPLNRGAERRVLGGRYVLRGLLGSGGMADVELAHDEVLDRQVAVKIMHARYADDPAFVERFKREARTAASLNHPNMVAVYDTGESDGRPFIVMEYVPGRTLRDVMRAERVLPGRALQIAHDTALALHAAHERGLIHRDVKPGNIMITDEGVVKVTDFGIARAMGAETVTQTAAVFGTAAYIAPEQAQGRPVDARTDIYALGVVLYEMLAGRQPFAAESPVALAYKHVSEDPVPPSQINREITRQMEAVIAKAMAKDPALRYANAREFAEDTMRAGQGLPVAAGAASFATTQAIRRPERTAYMTAPTPVTTVVDEPYEEPGGRAWKWLLALLVLLGLALLLWFLFLRPEPVQQVAVPRLVGLPVGQAQQVLERRGLSAEVERVADATVRRNLVIAQDPPQGTEVDPETVVALRVSNGPRAIEVPRLAGLEEGRAVQLIQQAGLSVGNRIEERSDEVAPGRVIRTNPPGGQRVAENTEVDYVIAEGPATVVIPPVADLNASDARAALRDSCGTPPCLDVREETRFSDDVPEGAAIGTDPGAGERVEFGAGVLLVISRGPEPEPEPSPPPPPPPSPTPSPTPSPAEPTETPTSIP